MTNTRKIIILLTFFNFIYASVKWLIFAYLPIYLKSINISDPLIGIIIAIFSFTMILMVAPFGILSDIYPSKKILQTGIILIIIYIFGMLFIKTSLLIIILTFIGGLGEVLFIVSLNSLYYKNIGETKTGRKIGFFILGALWGYACGPLLGGVIYEDYGMFRIFKIAILVLLFLLMISFLISEQEQIEFRLSEYKNDLKLSGTHLLILTIFFIALHFGVEQTNMTLFLSKNLNIGFKEIGTLYAITGLWMGFISYVAGYLVDKEKNIIFILSRGLILSGIALIGIYLSYDYLSFLTAKVVHTIGDAFAILSQGVLISRLFPDERVGGNYGFTQVARTSGIVIGAIGAGVINRYFGYGLPFALIGIIICFVGIGVRGSVLDI